jgi:hypothetical protein
MSDTELHHSALPADHGTNGPMQIGTTDVRQGVALGSVRYVLGISLALALVAFVVLYFLFL